jgi:hypothetical protein
MRKKPILLLLFIAGIAVSASAQTTTATPNPTHGMRWNASDWNLPPVVIRYLKNHPRIAKKVIAYYKEHGEWPPLPPNFPPLTAAPVVANINANVQWPSAPPPPASVPAGLR